MYSKLSSHFYFNRKIFEEIVHSSIYSVIKWGIPRARTHMMRRGQVDVVYTDFDKAFDHLDLVILLDKLQALGIHSDLLR